jgi:hypothetical protein
VVSLGDWVLYYWSFMSMLGYFSTGPLRACVKVAEYYDPSFIGTLTHVKSIGYVCECVSATDCA